MNIKLLTEHHLEFQSLKRGCTGSSGHTCQNATLLDITCHNSYVILFKPDHLIYFKLVAREQKVPYNWCWGVLPACQAWGFAVFVAGVGENSTPLKWASHLENSTRHIHSSNFFVCSCKSCPIRVLSDCFWKYD